MLKVVLIGGVRPEWIKLSRIISEFDKHFKLFIINTNQNFSFELSQIFFDELDIHPVDYNLNVVGKDLGETVGNIISKSYDVLKELNPDCLFILGDTNSALSAYSAKRLKIPIIHAEAGNRSFNDNVPEEINRRIIDHISDINLVYSENARQNLLREGIKPETIIKIHSPMKEVLTYYAGDIENSNIIEELKLEQCNYFVFSCHREENLDNDKKLNSILESLLAITEKYNKRIIFSCHPRTAQKIKNIKLSPLIEMHKPFGFFDYVKLQQNSLCVISDSGTIAEESNILRFPAVMMREEYERNEMEGNMILSGIKSERIIEAIEMAINQSPPETIEDYNDENVSQKVARIIQSYTDYVKCNVWKIYE
jgi:UDP-N-acetylglucosamine 2-epimerase (non-hydrolysing)